MLIVTSVITLKPHPFLHPCVNRGKGDKPYLQQGLGEFGIKLCLLIAWRPEEEREMQKQSLFIKGSWKTRSGTPSVIWKEGSQLGKGVQREAASMGGRAMVELPSGF